VREVQDTTGLAETPLLTDAVRRRMLEYRIVLLGTEINDETAGRFCAELMCLEHDDPTEAISVYINSTGGSVTAAMAMYDTMQLMSCDVATFGYGVAASMAQFLLSNGTPGKRHLLPHAKVMMHQPFAGLKGTATDILIQRDVYRSHKHEIAEIMAARTGHAVERIIADGERDRWFDAESAVTYGLVDSIVKPARKGVRSGVR
jgi:ATP-dependent Clp protease protease subunit